MKKIIGLIFVVFVTLGLTSCGSKIKIPDVESSGYDISSAINPLNNYLDDHTKQFDNEEVMDEFEGYMSSYMIMSNAYEMINIFNHFSLYVSVSEDENVEAISLHFMITFADLDMNQTTYDQAEMMFLQMRQDIDNATDYPVSLTLSFIFNNSNKAGFHATTEVNKELNGFAKQIDIANRNTESSQYDKTFLDYLLTEGYAEYYQREIILLMRFSESSFMIKYQPRDKTYSIYNENDISAEDYMADYIEGYDKIAWEN
jgi:hypothetical protein